MQSNSPLRAVQIIESSEGASRQQFGLQVPTGVVFAVPAPAFGVVAEGGVEIRQEDQAAGGLPLPSVRVLRWLWSRLPRFAVGAASYGEDGRSERLRELKECLGPLFVRSSHVAELSMSKQTPDRHVETVTPAVRRHRRSCSAAGHIACGALGLVATPRRSSGPDVVPGRWSAHFGSAIATFTNSTFRRLARRRITARANKPKVEELRVLGPSTKTAAAGWHSRHNSPAFLHPPRARRPPISDEAIWQSDPLRCGRSMAC